MSGLPGSGRSTVANLLASELGCAVLSVDTIERGMREAGVHPEQPIGLAAYAVANRLADEEPHCQRLETRDHELRIVPWERVVTLRDTWTPWPVEMETADTSSARME